MKILVVDDEAGLRRTASLILENEGYDIATASDGEEALARAAEWLPDQRHEAPRRIVCPIHPCGFLVSAHNGPDEARNVEPHIDPVSGCLQPLPVVLESTRDSGDRVVEEVQIFTDTEGVRQPVKGCSAGQIAFVSGRRGSQLRE